jgi:hypothetical protein
MDDAARQGMLSPLWVIAAIVGLLGLWVPFVASRTASTTGDVLIRTFHNVLPAFVVTTWIAGFFVVPVGDPLIREITLWAHHTSFLTLFLFLIAAEFFQMEAWWKIRRAAPSESVAASYWRLWALTEIVPAPVALTIFFTGLRLIREAPEMNSPSTFWLLTLILSFSILFWDGIFAYTPIVRSLRERWREASIERLPAGSAVRTIRGTSESVQLFLHFISWPFVFLLGVYRWDFPNRMSDSAAAFEARLSSLGFSAGWPQVATAVLLWVLMGVVVGLARGLSGYSGWRDVKVRVLKSK